MIHSLIGVVLSFAGGLFVGSGYENGIEWKLIVGAGLIFLGGLILGKTTL